MMMESACSTFPNDLCWCSVYFAGYAPAHTHHWKGTAMAKQVKTTVEMTDDLDGNPADVTIEFAFDGVSYEIDLSNENAKEMREFLADHIAAGRVVSKPKGKVKAKATDANGVTLDLSKVRVWANSNGYTVGAKGRIPQTILDAYKDAEVAA
jgi:hypothetical protein